MQDHKDKNNHEEQTPKIAKQHKIAKQNNKNEMTEMKCSTELTEDLNPII